MATSSNQIQADIAQTRTRIDNSLDAIESNPRASLRSLTAGVTNLVRRRPLTTLGFSLFAGALLQELLSGQKGGTSTAPSSAGTSTYTTAQPRSSTSTTYTTPGQSVAQGTRQAAATVAGTASNVADTAASAVSNVADTAASGASKAVGTAANVASTAADTAVSVASTAADTASSAASRVADIASEAATTVADTATSVATNVADTASSVATTVADTTVSAASRIGKTLSNTGKQVVHTVSNLGTTINGQIKGRPLSVLGISIGLGALLQPTLAPYVSQVTQRVQATVASVGESVSNVSADVAPALTLPNQNEAQQVQQALVPASVERAKKFANRELRDYLEARLEPVLSQASLRAGIVAAVTDKTSEVVESRLPSVLNRTLTGTRAVIVAAILGELLDAYTKSQQGEGKTTEIVRRELAQTLTQSSTQRLQRYFPEFREQYQQLQGQSV